MSVCRYKKYKVTVTATITKEVLHYDGYLPEEEELPETPDGMVTLIKRQLHHPDDLYSVMGADGWDYEVAAEAVDGVSVA